MAQCDPGGVDGMDGTEQRTASYESGSVASFIVRYSIIE
jgi:hypothetical protein